MRDCKLRSLILISIIAAISFLIMIFEFALPVFPPFLKLDFSDLPALLIGFSLGPASGIGVVFIRNLLHLTITATMGVGELANFLISGTFVFISAYFYARYKKAVLSLIVGTAGMVIMALITNLLIIIPLYEAILDLPLENTILAARAVNPAIEGINSYLAMVIAPFNLLKATLVSIVFYPIFKRIRLTSTYKNIKGDD
ncbi:ECF transporter S component [Halanaerobiaceae bacterium Z-7014]|uniref:Riboflavin transporter n=1 Tax=Halonatronomonas betaini TaxID=2778430 RepID=A0A931F775_9FIRM|nr:ECF transporter S component [Halonatronomonas betaini]MBF8436346.1 ECF transporter S component [Halonatronomonas betaini]